MTSQQRQSLSCCSTATQMMSGTVSEDFVEADSWLVADSAVAAVSYGYLSTIAALSNTHR